MRRVSAADAADIASRNEAGMDRSALIVFPDMARCCLNDLGGIVEPATNAGYELCLAAGRTHAGSVVGLAMYAAQ